MSMLTQQEPQDGDSLVKALSRCTKKELSQHMMYQLEVGPVATLQAYP